MAAPSRWISHDFPTINRSPLPAGERAIAADEADADMRRCFRQQFRSGVAKATLIEDEEVEAGEVWCDQSELLSQRSLRQAQRRTDDEPVRLGVQEHERAMSLDGRDRGRLRASDRRKARRTSLAEVRKSMRLREPPEPQPWLAPVRSVKGVDHSWWTMEDDV